MNSIHLNKEQIYPQTLSLEKGLDTLMPLIVNSQFIGIYYINIIKMYITYQGEKAKHHRGISLNSEIV